MTVLRELFGDEAMEAVPEIGELLKANTPMQDVLLRTKRHPAVVVGLQDLMACASFFSCCTEFVDHLRRVGGTLDCCCLPGLFATHTNSWDQYCTTVELQIRGEEGPRASSVFGLCRRCGSARLFVTTRQLRRADEGMTASVLHGVAHVTPVPQRSANVAIVAT